jgi:hypothetical protein
MEAFPLVQRLAMLPSGGVTHSRNMVAIACGEIIPSHYVNAEVMHSLF